MELSIKIKELRSSLNLSQEEFAARINTARSTVARWELGSQNPTKTSLNYIITEFKLPDNYFADQNAVAQIPQLAQKVEQPKEHNKIFSLRTLVYVLLIALICLSIVLISFSFINKLSNPVSSTSNSVFILELSTGSLALILGALLVIGIVLILLFKRKKS